MTYDQIMRAVLNSTNDPRTVFTPKKADGSRGFMNGGTVTADEFSTIVREWERAHKSSAEQARLRARARYQADQAG